jgi:DNA repair protein RadA/Sms
LRARKNRFGATDEVGIFEMRDKGLISISNPEKLFVSTRAKNTPGSVVSMIMQGTRLMLVEVQSLVNTTKLAFPKRIAQGIDSKRLELLIAVLIKRAGLPLYERDVFINIAGGINVKDPSIDLAICLSIASSFFDKSLAKKTLAVGEVGLLGDIREVVAEVRRIKEARRLGFTSTINSKSHRYLRNAVGEISKRK